MHGPIALLLSDPEVLSSLRFALSIEGFQLLAAGDDLAAAAAFVIDQAYQNDGLATLLALRECGSNAPAIVLATNPTASFRFRAGGAGATVVEMPLLGDELSSSIAGALESRKVA